MNRELNPPAIVAQAEDLATLAKEINAEHRAVEDTTRSSLEHARRAGEMLLRAKAACKHGEWLKWLAANVRFNERTARRYIEFAKSDVTSDLDGQLNAWQRIQGNTDPEPSEPVLFSPPDQEPSPDLTDEVDTEPEQFACNTCGEVFAKEMWHCQTCGGHWPMSKNECSNCPMPLAVIPPASTPPPPQPKVAEAVTLEDWSKMNARDRQKVLQTKGDGRFNNQGDNENIEWALWSWNPVTGCLHNCPYCYARDIANRFYPQKFQPSLIPSRLKAPRNTPFPTEKASQWMGHKNVFTCSMADLFGRWVPAEWIEAVLSEVRAAKQWNFLFLTKFPQRMAEFDFPDNAWVGTTVDCQARVANAEKAFRKIRAGVKWLSIEPMIEPLKFQDLGAFQWVVLGGSSRSSQTPEWHPPRQWVDAIEKEAERLGVAFYEKANLHGRIRGYPGEPVFEEPSEAPEPLRYMPSKEA